MEQPLAGARVLEVGGTLAVAAATKTFSDYGADVIKLEPPGGAALRRLPPFDQDLPDLDRGAYHLALDTGKRSVVVDLSTPSGRELLTRLSASVDLVFLHLDRAGIDAARAAIDRAGEPAPSTIALSEHGLDGPFAERVENDISLFAWTTRMRQHAIAGREPLRYAPYVATIQWGASAAAAGVAALWARERGGGQARIEVAGVEALTGNVDAWFLIWEFSGAELPRAPGQSRISYPAGCYPCADGHVLFAAQNEPFFSRLCEGIGHQELIGDPRFESPEIRAQHWEDFLAHLGPWLEARTRHEVFTELQRFGVMVAPVLDVAEAMADPQAVARGSFVEAASAGVGTVTLAGPPFRIPDAWQARPPPRLGSHTMAILEELGYSVDDRIALFRAGVVT